MLMPLSRTNVYHQNTLKFLTQSWQDEKLAPLINMHLFRKQEIKNLQESFPISPLPIDIACQAMPGAISFAESER